MKIILLVSFLIVSMTSTCHGGWPFDSIISAVDNSGQKIKTDIMTELGVIKGNSIKLAEKMDSLVKVTATFESRMTAYDKSQHTTNTTSVGGNQQITNQSEVINFFVDKWAYFAGLVVGQFAAVLLALIAMYERMMGRTMKFYKQILATKDQTIDNLIKRIADRETERDKAEAAADNWKDRFIEQQTNRIKELSNGKTKEAL